MMSSPLPCCCPALAVKFRGITTREALLIEGPVYWGEFSPFLEYEAAESAHWLAAGLEAAYEGFPEPVRDLIEVNGTIPAVPAAQVPEVMECYPGCRTFKIKVAEPGQSLADDVARVQAVREYITAQGRIPVLRVDANGGWSVEQAIEAAKALMPLDYMEQPCATAEELAEVRRQLMRNGLFVRVAADGVHPEGRGSLPGRGPTGCRRRGGQTCAFGRSA